MMQSYGYLKQVGYSEDDVQKRRIPLRIDTLTNGFIFEASKFFEDNEALRDYLFRVTGNTDYKECNQKSLKKKLYDMLALAKKRRKNKDKRFAIYLAAEFKPPVRSNEPVEQPSRKALERENESLKRKLENMEGDYDELQAKYDEAMRKLKRAGHV